MLIARGDGHEAAVRGRDIPLTTIVVSPRHDGAVGLEAQAVLPAGGNGHEAGVGRGYGALTGVKVVTASPRQDGAVRLQTEAVIRACGDGHEAAVGSWNVGLTVEVISPRHNGAVGFEA